MTHLPEVKGSVFQLSNSEYRITKIFGETFLYATDAVDMLEEMVGEQAVQLECQKKIKFIMGIVKVLENELCRTDDSYDKISDAFGKKGMSALYTLIQWWEQEKDQAKKKKKKGVTEK